MSHQLLFVDGQLAFAQGKLVFTDDPANCQCCGRQYSCSCPTFTGLPNTGYAITGEANASWQGVTTMGAIGVDGSAKWDLHRRDLLGEDIPFRTDNTGAFCQDVQLFSSIVEWDPPEIAPPSMGFGAMFIGGFHWTAGVTLIGFFHGSSSHVVDTFPECSGPYTGGSDESPFTLTEPEFYGFPPESPEDGTVAFDWQISIERVRDPFRPPDPP